MKNIILILMFLLLADVCFAQPRKSDRELAGLKGQVKEVKTRESVETYDLKGDLIKTEHDEGNCKITRNFTRDFISKKTVNEQIFDSSNSGFCTKIREDLPRENELIVYKLDYNDAMTYSKGEKDFEWVQMESASVGKMLLWRKYKYFDQMTRLKEELYITSGLIARTIIYRYEENKTEPFVAEFWNNNRLGNKHFYKYDYDTNGNWTKRTIIKFEPANTVSSPAEVKRTIFYY